MSTNYYLDAPHNDDGHLGKWVAGYFIAYAPDGVNDLTSWAAQMDGRRIFAESGYEVTKNEMVEMATKRVGHRSAAPSPNPHWRQFMNGGVLFARYEFC